jgi:hypothetical protein
MNDEHAGAEYLRTLIETFRKYKELAERAAAQVPDAALHEALDANTNSIAVIMKHVAGNLRSRWSDFLQTDGEKPGRNRDGEFIDTYGSRGELMDDWESGWKVLMSTLDTLTPDDLTRTVTIRSEPHSVLLAAQRSLAHTAYHVGQIMLVARILAECERLGGKPGSWQVLTMPRKPRA